MRGVLAARALRSFARESVGGIGLDRAQLAAGGPDVFEVPIWLGPAIHAAQSSAWRAVGVAISGLVTMSASASRPPDGSTRAASANTRRLSAERLTTPFGITASTEPSSNGSASIRARRSARADRGAGSALASCCGVMSTPVTARAAPTCSRPRTRPCRSRRRGRAPARFEADA